MENETQGLKHKEPPSSVSHWRLVFDQSFITPAVREWPYRGSGTPDDPFVVVWTDDDARDPMRMPEWKKWMLVVTVAVSTLGVSFVSSVYAGGLEQVMDYFEVSEVVATLGLSLDVLGFAIGPTVWYGYFLSYPLRPSKLLQTLLRIFNMSPHCLKP